MLDAQRYRHSPKLEHIQFTRRILWALLSLLILAGGLLVFHGLFVHALVLLLVLFLTVLLVVGMGNAHDWCRITLGVLSVGLGVAFFLLARFPPEALPATEASTGHKWIPIWSGLAALSNITLAGCFIFSSKVQYSSRRLFTLW